MREIEYDDSFGDDPRRRTTRPDERELEVLRTERYRLGDWLRFCESAVPELLLGMEQAHIRRHRAEPMGMQIDVEEQLWLAARRGDLLGQRRPYVGTVTAFHRVQQVAPQLHAAAEWAAIICASQTILYRLRERPSAAQLPFFDKLWLEHQSLRDAGRTTRWPAAGLPQIPIPGEVEEALDEPAVYRAPAFHPLSFFIAVEELHRIRTNVPALADTPQHETFRSFGAARSALDRLARERPAPARKPGMDVNVMAQLDAAYHLLAGVQPGTVAGSSSEDAPGVMALARYAVDVGAMSRLSPEARAQLGPQDMQASYTCGIVDLKRAVRVGWFAWRHIAYACLGALTDQPWIDATWEGRGPAAVREDVVTRLRERAAARAARPARDFISIPADIHRGERDALRERARQEWAAWLHDEREDDPGFRPGFDFDVEKEREITERSLGTSFRAGEQRLEAAKSRQDRDTSARDASRVARVQRAIDAAFPAFSKPAKPPGGGRSGA